MFKKVSKKVRPDLDLAQDWRHIALCSGSHTLSPLRTRPLLISSQLMNPTHTSTRGL